MRGVNRLSLLLAAALVPWAVSAQEASKLSDTTEGRMHAESARKHDGPQPPSPEIDPAIPQGMTLDEVLDYAGTPPPADYPVTIPDAETHVFTLIEQLEYRFADDDDVSDHLGWEAQGWVGGDYQKFWWKNEGEAIFEGNNEGESETDLLYSRLVTPFWNFQVGAQYANEWHSGDYEDRWSGAVALQGLAPYKFELDNSLYISEEGDVTAAFEAEYDIRITQRLVLQPRAEAGFAFDDIPDRDLGAGMTDVTVDLRLRYEIRREFAPYLGIRFSFLVGQTDDIAEDKGLDTEQFQALAGLRFAF